MKTKNTNPVSIPLLVLAAILVMAGCSKEGDLEFNQPETGDPASYLQADDNPLKSTSSDQNRILARIRSATAKYHDIEVALSDGYDFGSPCVSSESGGMGYHLVNMDLLMNPSVDPEQPEALVYEPMKNGRMRLVAVEFIVPYPVWDQENGVPMLGNQAFDDMPYFPPPLGPNYQLHVWVWRHNPLGMYAPYNPNVSCEYAFEGLPE